MKALISLNEPRESGYRIADTHPDGFVVAEPLFWVDCGDEVKPDAYWYNPETQSCIAFPPPPEFVPRVIPVTDTGAGGE